MDSCCIASSLSVYFQHRVFVDQADFTYYVIFVYLTYTLEMCVGISTSCMPSLARLHKEKTGIKLHSVVSSMGSPFRSFRKSMGTSSQASSKGLSIEKYSTESPHTSIRSDSVHGLQAHETSHTEDDRSLVANQNFSQLSNDSRIHRSVDISQTVVVTSHGERASENWGRTYP